MASTLGSRSLGLEDGKSNSLVQCLGNWGLGLPGVELGESEAEHWPEIWPRTHAGLGCECGVSPWEVKLGTGWPTLGLGRDYLLLGSALWNLRWKCSCLSRNENKEFIFVSVKVVTKMPCDRIRGWSRLIKSEFCLDEKFVKCSVVITSCRTGIKSSSLPLSAFLNW